MEIIVNGKRRDVTTGGTIAALVAELGFDTAYLAVEHNGRVLEGSELDGALLAQGDKVEIVRLVWGG